MHDVIVVGGGPAGMTAALYALRNGKSALVIEREGFGGQITHSPKVENYPGTLRMSGKTWLECLTTMQQPYLPPEAKQEAVRIGALGRNEFALGRKESASELAEKAVWLDPTAEGPRILYLQTHGYLPRITLSGVEDEK